MALPAGPGWWAAPLGALGAKVARVRAATPPAPMLVVTPAPALLLVAVPEVPVWLVRAVTPVVGAAQIPVPWGPRAVPSMARVAVSAVAVAEWPPVPARRLPGWGAMAMPIAG
ncbi:hypothetical protein OSJ04_25375, partial [Mycobacterium ulcerans]